MSIGTVGTKVGCGGKALVDNLPELPPRPSPSLSLGYPVPLDVTRYELCTN